MSLEKLKFPIGEFQKPSQIAKEIISNWISEIESFPSRLINEVSQLSDLQLDTPYRENGWTIRQVIHHCADSHINSFIRFKLALTENQPTIKPYFEDKWAELIDSKNMPIAPSLKILEGTHQRWTILLNKLTEDDLSRTFIHPENQKQIRIDENIGIYAWHGNHHLAHITETKKKNGW